MIPKYCKIGSQGLGFCNYIINVFFKFYNLF